MTTAGVAFGIRRARARAWIAAAATPLLFGCSGQVESRGGVEVIVATNLETADYDAVRIRVSQQIGGAWQPRFDGTRQVPGEVVLPTTLAIAAGADPDQNALIDVSLLAGGSVLVERAVQTDVPKARFAELVVDLAAICEGAACPAGSSCLPDTGNCDSVVVPSADLPTYTAGDERCIAGGSGAVAIAGCPCPTAGARACAGNAQATTLVCAAARWGVSGTCASGENCDTSADRTQGNCVAIDVYCRDTAPGGAVCSDGTTVVRCGADGTSHAVAETCPAGGACLQGACLCPAGTTGCGGACVDPQRDTNNCGACGVACPSAAACSSGQCVCPASETACNGACVDLAGDPRNCGGCATACPIGAACAQGACACPAGLTACASSCIDLQTDSNNCGGCGSSCPKGASCIAGVCRCAVGAVCNGSCVDVTSDVLNCGACGQACPVGAACYVGQCQCPWGETRCGGACADFQSDPFNCGRCGAVCPSQVACRSGGCTCVGTNAVCGGRCVDTTADTRNCGSCGIACGSGEVCTESVCRPIDLDAGIDDANAPIDAEADGTAPPFDAAADGGLACRVACDASQPCEGGSCVLPADAGGD
jgi:hypothetical protein